MHQQMTAKSNTSMARVQVSEIMDPEAGHVHRDGVVLACEVLECCPWFEFADLDVYGNTTEEEGDDLSTDPDELLELGTVISTMCLATDKLNLTMQYHIQSVLPCYESLVYPSHQACLGCCSSKLLSRRHSRHFNQSCVS